MNYISWYDFKCAFPRDEDKWDTVRHFVFLIDNVVIWRDDFVEPYNDFFAYQPLSFESVLVDVDGEEKEAVRMINANNEEYTLLAPEMITALLLSDPVIIERWISMDKDGIYGEPGWTFDPNKQDFPRFYQDGEEDGVLVRYWSNGDKEFL